EGANLLGIKITDAKIEHITWGKHLQQEYQARQAKKHRQWQDAMDLYIECEEVYRNLFRACEVRGLYEEAGVFFQKEMLMRREQWPKTSLRWIWSVLVDLFCGYGERPARVVIFSIVIIAL